MSTGENIGSFLYRQIESVPLSSLWVGSGEPIRGCSEITWVGGFQNTETSQSQGTMKTRGVRVKSHGLGSGG